MQLQLQLQLQQRRQQLEEEVQQLCLAACLAPTCLDGGANLHPPKATCCCCSLHSLQALLPVGAHSELSERARLPVAPPFGPVEFFGQAGHLQAGFELLGALGSAGAEPVAECCTQLAALDGPCWWPVACLWPCFLASADLARLAAIGGGGGPSRWTMETL